MYTSHRVFTIFLQLSLGIKCCQDSSAVLLSFLSRLSVHSSSSAGASVLPLV